MLLCPFSGVPVVSISAESMIAVPAESIVHEVFAPLVLPPVGRTPRYWISWWTTSGRCPYSPHHRYEFLKSRGLLLSEPEQPAHDNAQQVEQDENAANSYFSDLEDELQRPQQDVSSDDEAEPSFGMDEE